MDDPQHTRIVGYRHAVLSPDDIEFFRGNLTAMQIWCYAMSMGEGWKFRRQQIMDYLKISDFKWRSSVKFLRDVGVMERKITKDRSGKIVAITLSFHAQLNKLGERNKKKRNDIHQDVEKPQRGKTTKLSTSREGSMGDSESGTEEGDMDNRQRQEMRDRFLSRFTGKHTFQTFDDAQKKEKQLSRVLFRKNYELDDLNDHGAGIFFTVNECDGKGRKKENVTRVRAIFVDLDGSPIEPVLAYNPHIVVESSSGKYHAYWLVDDFPMEAFTDTQKNMARMFAGDKAVNDLSRVMRVPGYYHRKSGRFLTKTIIEGYHQTLSYSDVVSLFPPPQKEKFSAKKYRNDTPADKQWKGQWGTSEGERNNGLARFCGWMVKANYGDRDFYEGAMKWGMSCIPPMSEHEIQGVVKSVGRYR